MSSQLLSLLSALPVHQQLPGSLVELAGTVPQRLYNLPGVPAWQPVVLAWDAGLPLYQHSPGRQLHGHKPTAIQASTSWYTCKAWSSLVLCAGRQVLAGGAQQHSPRASGPAQAHQPGKRSVPLLPCAPPTSLAPHSCKAGHGWAPACQLQWLDLSKGGPTTCPPCHSSSRRMACKTGLLKQELPVGMHQACGGWLQGLSASIEPVWTRPTRGQRGHWSSGLVMAAQA